MNKTKTEYDVRGYEIKCINYIKCPLCYGCRNYNSVDPDCKICIEQNKKYNICNTELHKTDLIAKMITKNNIKISEPTKFINNEGE